MNKIRVGVLFGGQSTEHEVSLRSAKNIFNALDKEKFEPILIGIDKSGKWHISSSLSLPEKPNLISPKLGSNIGELINIEDRTQTQIDVIFPVLHGINGEDGTIQGLLKLSNIPFVGAGILGSAVGMDKEVAKRLLRDAKIPVAQFIVVRNLNEISYSEATKKLGSPLFIKPSNSGSSVGVHKVKNETDFKEALQDALSYDSKVIIEEAIVGQEIECSVLGNENPTASALGEIVPHHDFYSYEAKYLDENGAELLIPANLDKNTAKKVQKLAIKTFKTLCCEGMARVDFFVTKDKNIYVNEINTIPGFTNISMYPKLWEASGLSQKELVIKLIDLAIERHKRESSLNRTYLKLH